MDSMEQPAGARRKAISRRLRYEILKRDNGTCRYCGLKAGETELTIDHVVPVALGGTDEPANLVAACKDCNAGKTSSSPDAALVAQVDEDAMRWAAAMRLAAEQQGRDRLAIEARIRPFTNLWSKLAPADLDERYEAPSDWRERVNTLLDAGLPLEVLLDATRIAFSARNADNVFYYMVGVATNKLADLQIRARALLDAGAV